ncbi:hypothetical protein FPV67DRAFT_254813 [Lyophyllum atratum]|nr:hypothetical protein FPV67DRAFT_254813 [Lyophyllum atratum]
MARLSKRWKALKPRTSATSADIARTCLVALNESADAFPPLRSVTGGVLAVWNAAERAKTAQKKARAIANRCYEILGILADSTADPSNISSEMGASIHTFTILLEDICREMEPLQKRSRRFFVLHLNRHADELDGFGQRLDAAHQSFMLAAALRTEKIQFDIRCDVAGVSDKLELIHCDVRVLRGAVRFFFYHHPIQIRGC